ncbi:MULTISPECIES: hypothetical protein [unclassified Streptomyces]|uniref:hypothetical protein n=1 Tax=unclassified Streptomyces TaxID=2593676 RepID=UPI001BE9FAD5|nr:MULTISPECIES: hypothetical protein [unclassified Streptomyces]MBT2402011.1 hypothetical protein [Streptomyces sp. ISL-21]MBT2454258.1 hypothetical protein [Streptomyces sp. ISL-86]MBT2609479.1 hypothetical protein [Streptomyces sp. ISL-87]
MATESEGAGTTRSADSLTRGLLGRLTTSARPGEADGAVGGGARRRHDFLPDLPGPMLLALLSDYHRRGVQVGFPELTGART